MLEENLLEAVFFQSSFDVTISRPAIDGTKDIENIFRDNVKGRGVAFEGNIYIFILFYFIFIF